MIFSPVLGFLPSRAALEPTLKVPKPTRVILSPPDSAPDTAETNPSTASAFVAIDQFLAQFGILQLLTVTLGQVDSCKRIMSHNTIFYSQNRCRSLRILEKERIMSDAEP